MRTFTGTNESASWIETYKELVDSLDRRYEEVVGSISETTQEQKALILSVAQELLTEQLPSIRRGTPIDPESLLISAADTIL